MDVLCEQVAAFRMLPISRNKKLLQQCILCGKHNMKKKPMAGEYILKLHLHHKLL